MIFILQNIVFSLIIVVLFHLQMLQSFKILRHSSLRNNLTVYPLKRVRLFSTVEKVKDSKASSNDADIVITPRNVDYSAWYNDILIASDMIDSSPVRGCMVIKPWGMAVWESIRDDLDKRIKETDTQNAYFPLLIPKSFLAKEAEHVEGFAKECAVVTHYRLKATEDKSDLIPDPEAKLEEPLIIRPTSETIIWNMFSKWINSHRDLPLKVNQWANVMRWEMRTRPFIRTSEFLWQEGHTAHATGEEAKAFSLEILDLYETVCRDILAVPVIKGIKSPSERFAGADETFTIEALMQNGWALQSGTSHYLGQNFAKAFKVYYQREDSKRDLVYATSWGVSTRLVGALLMTHSDDKGILLPPKVAPIQCIIVPVITGKAEKDEKVLTFVKSIRKQLLEQNIRCKIDDRKNIRNGAKYYEWERKGVPLRMEIGPRDIDNQSITLALRHTGEKRVIKIESEEILSSNIKDLLTTIQNELYQSAVQRRQSKTFPLTQYSKMKEMIESNDPNQLGFYLVPWKCDTKNEEQIKEETKATIRCYPLENNLTPPPEGTKCFYSGEQATHIAIFARAF